VTFFRYWRRFPNGAYWQDCSRGLIFNTGMWRT